MPASITAIRAEVETLHDLRQDVSAARPATFPNTLVETAVTSHYRQGGIDVDTATMRSSVPGLYVAGGVGGHSNGLIGLATYDGKVVADGVARDFADAQALIGRTAESRLEARQARSTCAMLGRTVRRPTTVKEKIRAS